MELVFLLSYVMVAAVLIVPNFVDIPIHFVMVATAFFAIIAGAHKSMVQTAEAERTGERKTENIGMGDAQAFPLVASAGLFSLFLVFTFFKEYVTVILTIYACGLGVFSTASMIGPMVESVLPGWFSTAKVSFFVPTIPHNAVTGALGLAEPPTGEPDEPVEITPANVICVAISAVFGVWYYYEEHFAANNVLGMGLAVTGIEFINLGSFQIGCILLSGLFFYDVFWVFLSKPLIGSNVMVTVAKSFKGPIKFLFKKPGCDVAEKGAECMSLLGLGDVVLPGLFIALILRFDESRKPGSRTYFYTVLVAYLIGLAATYVAMIWSEHAQPALLYLVPSCIIIPSAVAAARGEFGELYKYSEEVDEEEEKSAGKSTEEKKAE